MNKKILVVCQHFWPENFRINDIVDFFLEKNQSVEVLCGIPNYPKGLFYDGYSYVKNRKQLKGSIKIRRVFEIPRGNNSNFRIFVNYMSFPIASIFHLPRLLFKKYDKIFLYSLSPVYMTFTGIILGRIKKIETTMYVLDLWPENLFSVLPVKNKMLRMLVTKTSHWHYRHVDKLIVLSEKMKKHMIDDLGLGEKEIIVLPQTSEKIYEKDIHDKKISKKFKDKFTVMYAGNISPAQSYGTMLAAAKILQDKGYDDIEWVIIGDGMSAADMKNDVKQLGVDGSFTFEGMKPIEDIPKYTPVANVLVGCLVKSELLEATIPAKVMSYIAAGKPIVLAMDGEVKDLIEDQIGCGFVGPTEDAQSLADNIEKIYKMKSSEQEIFGKKAKKYHFAHLERNISLQKLYDFIML